MNLSRVSISDERLGAGLSFRMLSASGVDPSQLVFEITETAAMSDMDAG